MKVVQYDIIVIAEYTIEKVDRSDLDGYEYYCSTSQILGRIGMMSILDFIRL